MTIWISRLNSLALMVTLLAAPVLASHAEIANGTLLAPGDYAATWTVPSSRKFAQSVGHIEGMRTERIRGVTRSASRSAMSGLLVFDGISASMKPMRIALDESRGVGRGYDRLYIDANRNGDLSDDPRFVADKASSAGQVSFSGVLAMQMDRVFPGCGNPNKGRLYVVVTLANGKPQRGAAYLCGYWRARVASSSGTVDARLEDGNGNGRHSDRSMWAVGEAGSLGDAVILDWDRRGLDNMRSRNVTPYTVLQPVNIHGALYVLTPSTSGNRLSVSRYHGPKGRLSIDRRSSNRITDHLVSVSIARPDGVFSLPIDGSSVEMPSGDYRMLVVNSEARTRSGEVWRLAYVDMTPLSVPDGGLRAIGIGGNTALTLAAGASPIRLRRGLTATIPTALSIGDRTLRLVHMIGRGSGSRAYLRDSSGRVLCVGQLANDGNLGYRIRVPRQAKPGAYTIECILDMGPFGGVARAAGEARIE